MGWYWNPLGALGIFTGTISLLLATLVFATGPHRPQNRRLALVLSLEFTTTFCGGGLLYLTDDAATAFALQTLAYVVAVPVTLAYLHFLAALPSAVARPLRWRGMPWLFLALGLAYVAFFLLRLDLFIAGVGPTPYARYESMHGPLLFPVAIVPGIVVVLYGGLVAFLMWWQSEPGTLRRRQGASYLVAFGWRDATWLTTFILFFGLGILTPVTIWGVMIALGVFPILLSYAVLRHQLFDIDLKIKWTIRRGTVAGIVLAAFLIISQLVENLANDTLGLFAGSVAAGLLLFLITPLSRIADRVADATMPHVRDDDEYRTVRKRDVYLAALEGALVDGTVSERERDMLVRLQDQLGLSATEARALETTMARTAGSIS